MKIVFKKRQNFAKNRDQKSCENYRYYIPCNTSVKTKKYLILKIRFEKRLLFIAVIILFDVDLISTSWKCPSRSWWIDQSPARMKTKVLRISWIADSFVGDTRPNISNDQDKYYFFKKRSFKYHANKILLWVCCRGKKLVHVSWAYVH